MKNNILSVKIIIGLWILLYLIGRFTDIDKYLCGKGINNISGQYYRYFTASFLHASLFHVVANSAILYFITIYLDGKLNGVAIALLGIIAGTATNVIFSFSSKNAEKSVGGSVIIFAIIGLMLMMQIIYKSYEPFKLGTVYADWTIGAVVIGNIINGQMRFFDFSNIKMHSISFAMGIVMSLIYYALHVIA